MNDELIRRKFHEALDPVQPDPHLRSRVIAGLPSSAEPAQRIGGWNREWMLSATALGIAIVIVAGLVYVRIPRSQTLGRSPEHAIPRADSGMVTANVGWAVSQNTNSGASTMLRTTDAGRDWSVVTPPTRNPAFLAPYFVDAWHAWVAESAGNWPIVVYETSDGGATWHAGQPIKLARTLFVPPSSLFFVDSKHGWLLLANFYTTPSPGRPNQLLFGTDDGGHTWKLLSEAGAPTTDCTWQNVVFSSPQVGWITTLCNPRKGPALLVSRDGGLTWNSQALPIAVSGAVPDGLHFFDVLHGVFQAETGSSGGALLVTTDGGLSWMARKVPGEAHLVVDFIDAEHGWAIGGPSAELSKAAGSTAVVTPLYRTDDGGLTWAPVNTDLLLESDYGHVNDLYFVDASDGFAVAIATTSGVFTLLRTGDGGVTWSVVGRIPTA